MNIVTKQKLLTIRIIKIWLFYKITAVHYILLVQALADQDPS